MQPLTKLGRRTNKDNQNKIFQKYVEERREKERRYVLFSYYVSERIQLHVYIQEE